MEKVTEKENITGKVGSATTGASGVSDRSLSTGDEVNRRLACKCRAKSRKKSRGRSK